VVAGQPGVDHPVLDSALSVMPLGQDQALTSRVRQVTDTHLVISSPRDGVGGPAPFVPDDMLDLSWQAEDGLRSVPAESAAVVGRGDWKVRITGPASRIQRRDAVRAPIGLSISVAWDRVVLTGSTVDLSEGGVLCVFRPNGDVGLHTPFPKRGQPLALNLDLYSDVLDCNALLVRRLPREDQLLEWSLRFVDLPEPAADLIRSHVFTALRNARARGLSRMY